MSDDKYCETYFVFGINHTYHHPISTQSGIAFTALLNAIIIKLIIKVGQTVEAVVAVLRRVGLLAYLRALADKPVALLSADGGDVLAVVSDRRIRPRRKEIEDRQDRKCERDYSCENREFHRLFDLLLLPFVFYNLGVYSKFI